MTSTQHAGHDRGSRTRGRATSLRFSLIIPALNEEGCIAACIGSIQAQFEAPAEIIVIDNGCVDATADIARAMGCLVVRDERRGLSNARNCGARVATGDVLCFVDADCRLAQGWLRSARRCFSDPRVGAVSGLSIYVHRNPQKLLLYNLYTLGVALLALLSICLRGRMLLTGNNLAIRRELFLELGGYEPVIGEGYWLSQRLWRQRRYRGRLCARMILWNSPRGFEHSGFVPVVMYWARATANRVSQEGYTYKSHASEETIM
jgi:glycosyltransferase involved in cell wall biosynthesis